MDKLTIGILGAFHNGKSTLVNCLLGEKAAKTGGYGKSVTSINTKYVYGESSAAIVYCHDKIIGQYPLGSFTEDESFLKENFTSVQITGITMVMPANILKFVNILDTPGLNANEHDTSMALTSLDNMDFAILLVKNKGLSETEKIICRELSNKGKPFSIIMNCMDECDDMWNPSAEQNQKVANYILADLKMQNISPYSFGGEQIWITNLLWYWHSICKGCYSAVEQKQIKRIVCFFDLFFDSSKPSKIHLKEKSCFCKLSEALQEKKNLCALNLFVTLFNNFECYKESVLKKFHHISESTLIIISEEITHLQKSIYDNRMKYTENCALMKEKQKQLAKIEAESSYDFSSLDNLCGRILRGTQKYIDKRLKQMNIHAEMSTLERRNKDILILENTYQDFIQYLYSINLK